MDTLHPPIATSAYAHTHAPGSGVGGPVGGTLSSRLKQYHNAPGQ
jgi:hypothetical protein